MADVFDANTVTLSFEDEGYLAVNDARWTCFAELLAQLRRELAVETALDVGCGIGYFASRIRDAGLNVSAIDGREENIAELRRRYPDIDAGVGNVEQPDVLLRYRGTDLVLCAGLLYHLENPFRFVRALGDLAPKFVILESQVLPSAHATFQLVEEGSVPNQGLTYLALVPSELAIVKMLYRSGFAHVFRTTVLPAHPDFAETSERHRRRTVLVATTVPVTSAVLVRLPEPKTPKVSWRKPLPLSRRVLNRIRMLLRGAR